jgi:ribosomal protein L37E
MMRRSEDDRGAAGEYRPRGLYGSGTAEGREASPAAPPAEACEVCGGAMYGLHCKLVCSNCGYRRDCSDP